MMSRYQHHQNRKYQRALCDVKKTFLLNVLLRQTKVNNLCNNNNKYNCYCIPIIENESLVAEQRRQFTHSLTRIGKLVRCPSTHD